MGLPAFLLGAAAGLHFEQKYRNSAPNIEKNFNKCKNFINIYVIERIKDENEKSK